MELNPNFQGNLKVLELEPENVMGYVLLSNICASASNRHLSENIEQQRKEKVNLLLHLTTWPFEKTCVNSQTTSEVFSLFSMHCWEQWECYVR
jgi:hypothetical protein